MLFLGNQDLDGSSALLFAISSESQCAPVWFSLTERPTRDEYICSLCSCDWTIRQMEMLNGIARNHWNETVNKYYNLAKALFQSLSVACEASYLCLGQFSKYFGNEEEGRKAGRGIWGVNCPNSHTPEEIPHTYVPTNPTTSAFHKSQGKFLTNTKCPTSPKIDHFFLEREL